MTVSLNLSKNENVWQKTGYSKLGNIGNFGNNKPRDKVIFPSFKLLRFSKLGIPFSSG